MLTNLRLDPTAVLIVILINHYEIGPIPSLPDCLFINIIMNHSMKTFYILSMIYVTLRAKTDLMALEFSIDRFHSTCSYMTIVYCMNL